jgi:predicted ATP-dependent endonuclease of OLD family
MQIQPPELIDIKNQILAMFCLERRMTRELYWAGFGFQVWCQLLTHVVRAAESTIFVIDEPEIYLHADLQRQLVSIARELGLCPPKKVL